MSTKPIPIVSLDRIYLDLENIYYLDCTRIDNRKNLISRTGTYDVDTQIKKQSHLLKTKK